MSELRGQPRRLFGWMGESVYCVSTHPTGIIEMIRAYKGVIHKDRRLVFKARILCSADWIHVAEKRRCGLTASVFDLDNPNRGKQGIEDSIDCFVGLGIPGTIRRDRMVTRLCGI
jgi:hypothetical protein